MCFNFRFHHIPGTDNKIADCLSRLTRTIREAEHFSLTDPILADYSKVKKIAYKSKIETDDQWVEQLAKSAMVDTDYLAMIQHIELGTSRGDIPKNCELSEMNTLEDLSVVILKRRTKPSFETQV